MKRLMVMYVIAVMISTFSTTLIASKDKGKVTSDQNAACLLKYSKIGGARKCSEKGQGVNESKKQSVAGMVKITHKYRNIDLPKLFYI